MGRRGPAPKPNIIKLREGNPGHRPINLNEPRPRPITPPCPDWLDDEAKREWRKVAPQLFRLGLLTEVDGPALACYCQALAMLRTSAEALRAKGSMTFSTPSGYKQQRPEVGMMNRAMVLVRAFAQEFGLTPSARARLEQPDGNDVEQGIGGLR